MAWQSVRYRSGGSRRRLQPNRLPSAPYGFAPALMPPVLDPWLMPPLALMALPHLGWTFTPLSGWVPAPWWLLPSFPPTWTPPLMAPSPFFPSPFPAPLAPYEPLYGPLDPPVDAFPPLPLQQLFSPLPSLPQPELEGPDSCSSNHLAADPLTAHSVCCVTPPDWCVPARAQMAPTQIMVQVLPAALVSPDEETPMEALLHLDSSSDELASPAPAAAPLEAREVSELPLTPLCPPRLLAGSLPSKHNYDFSAEDPTYPALLPKNYLTRNPILDPASQFVLSQVPGFSTMPTHIPKQLGDFDYRVVRALGHLVKWSCPQNVPGDGDCLFHAFLAAAPDSLFASSKPTNAASLRQFVAMATPSLDPKVTLQNHPLGSDTTVNMTTLAVEIAKPRHPLDVPVLGILAHMYNCHIEVYMIVRACQALGHTFALRFNERLYSWQYNTYGDATKPTIRLILGNTHFWWCPAPSSATQMPIQPSAPSPPHAATASPSGFGAGNVPSSNERTAPPPQSASPNIPPATNSPPSQPVSTAPADARRARAALTQLSHLPFEQQISGREFEEVTCDFNAQALAYYGYFARLPQQSEPDYSPTLLRVEIENYPLTSSGGEIAFSKLARAQHFQDWKQSAGPPNSTPDPDGFTTQHSSKRPHPLHGEPIRVAAGSIITDICTANAPPGSARNGEFLNAYRTAIPSKQDGRCGIRVTSASKTDSTHGSLKLNLHFATTEACKAAQTFYNQCTPVQSGTKIKCELVSSGVAPPIHYTLKWDKTPLSGPVTARESLYDLFNKHFGFSGGLSLINKGFFVTGAHIICSISQMYALVVASQADRRGTTTEEIPPFKILHFQPYCSNCRREVHPARQCRPEAVRCGICDKTGHATATCRGEWAKRKECCLCARSDLPCAGHVLHQCRRARKGLYVPINFDNGLHTLHQFCQKAGVPPPPPPAPKPATSSPPSASSPPQASPSSDSSPSATDQDDMATEAPQPFPIPAIPISLTLNQMGSMRRSWCSLLKNPTAKSTTPPPTKQGATASPAAPTSAGPRNTANSTAATSSSIPSFPSSSSFSPPSFSFSPPYVSSFPTSTSSPFSSSSRPAEQQFSSPSQPNATRPAFNTNFSFAASPNPTNSSSIFNAQWPPSQSKDTRKSLPPRASGGPSSSASAQMASMWTAIQALTQKVTELQELLLQSRPKPASEDPSDSYAPALDSSRKRLRRAPIPERGPLQPAVDSSVNGPSHSSPRAPAAGNDLSPESSSPSASAALPLADVSSALLHRYSPGQIVTIIRDLQRNLEQPGPSYASQLQSPSAPSSQPLDPTDQCMDPSDESALVGDEMSPTVD